MDWKITVFLILLSFLIFVTNSDAQSSHICTRRRIEYWTERYCSAMVWWWCAHHSTRQHARTIIDDYCCPGWVDGSSPCSVPICNPSCGNGGTCIEPGKCRCNYPYSGEYTACATLKCSHLVPCYPGKCLGSETTDSCACDTGFSGTGQDACLTMAKDKGMPDIGLSTVTLSHIRRTDNSTKFSFAMDGTTDLKDTFWINQKDFNYIMFEFHSLYEPPSLSYRPNYIRDSGFGIVGGQIFVNISKIPRSGGAIRDVAFSKQYTCSGLSNTVPNKDIAKCIVTENQFYVNLEDGDWFTVVFTAQSGGFRTLLSQSYFWSTQVYRGQTDQKVVEFKFDFEVPKHCSERNTSVVCTATDLPLRIENEFTKSPVNITWGGWTDSMSGIKSYHLEIFKLSVTLYGNLTETTPLKPVHSADINHTHETTYNYIHKPLESGMYSVLLQVTDKANNSKIARRLVLYDSDSNIIFKEEEDKTLFVSSAVPESGYMWQTVKIGTETEFTVQWTNHFFNKLIVDGKLLNKVSAYPIQFQEIQRDGILKSEKFVYPGFDDNDGERTIEEKPNKNGIVRFEVNAIYTDDTDEPVNGWINVNGLSESHRFSTRLRDGKFARIWVRAHDVLNNTKADKTEVHFDSTPPYLSDDFAFLRNQNGTYNHTSRLTFDAWDADSGVHKIGFTLIRDDTRHIQYNGYAAASVKNISCKAHECKCVLEKCFIVAQNLELDNCWFMMAKEDLDKVNVTVEVTVYNQALLETTFSVTVDKIHELNGLEKSEEDKSASIGGIIGGVIAAAIIIALVIIIIVLIRRGKLEPVRERLRPMTVRIRNTIRRRSKNAYAKSDEDKMYIYGGMTFDERQSWHMSRNNVTLESLLKSGHFANIFKVSVSYDARNQESAVAMCLKEGYTNRDKELMMAKINFSGTQLVNHPNVLRFVGAVVDDDDIGPFMIYEYCENGSLRDYLESQRNNVTMELQENLYRFGLDTCKGMEFLVSRKIVHRRLAARNILLNFLNEVKSSGFGPQNFELNDSDNESGKKLLQERIPIKWMAPECMDSTAGANEKSDVWSYGVVLWEIFSLGQTPYLNIKSRDLPTRLIKGERLPKPELCDNTWYGLMQRTWTKSPDKRPTFTEMKEELGQLFTQPAGGDFYYYKR